MPTKAVHDSFIDFLVKGDWLDFELDYQILGDIMYGRIENFGGRDPNLAFHTPSTNMRSWLQSLARRGETQDKLTALYRCGLAHLALERAEGAWLAKHPGPEKTVPWKRLYEDVLKSLLKEGWDRAGYRG